VRLKTKSAIVGVLVIILGLCSWLVFFKDKPRELATSKSHVAVSKKTESSTMSSQSEKQASDVSKAEETHSETTSSKEKKEDVKAFQETAVEQGFYILINDKLELATKDNLKDIDKQIKNPVVSQMEKDGQMITVISDSEGSVE
jgi:cytoskeletal protein RodZ